MVEVILLMYYTYAFVFGWILWADSGFEAGNTTLSFVGLYMLARYVKTYHSERIIRINGGGNFGPGLPAWWAFLGHCGRSHTRGVLSTLYCG